MTTFNGLVLEFNNLVRQQKFMEALDKFYADEVVSTDNLNPPIIGLDALRSEVKKFMENATIETMEVVTLAAETNLSVTNWYHSFEHKKFGRVSRHQFSVQRWQHNKIIQESHFYSE